MPRHPSFLHSITDVRTRTRGYLPHWDLQGATYSVTFRLHGSLPREVVERLREERKTLERMITGGTRKLTPRESLNVRADFERRVDAEVHEQTEVAWMSDPHIAEIVATTITHFEGTRYHLPAWCVMPNHVHVVVTPVDSWALFEIVHTWKSFSSNRANKLLNRDGRFWSREYFDRIIRDEEDYANTIAYVLDNPAKAGLLDWPWNSAGWKPADRPAGSRRSV